MKIDNNASGVVLANIEINASLQRVWDLLADIENWPTWNPQVRVAELQGKLEPGTTFIWKTGPSKVTSKLVVVQPGENSAAIGWTGKSAGVSVRHTYQFESRGDTTLVTTRESFDGLLVRLFTGYLSKSFQKAMDDALISLKHAAEKP